MFRGVFHLLETNYVGSLLDYESDPQARLVGPWKIMAGQAGWLRHDADCLEMWTADRFFSWWRRADDSFAGPLSVKLLLFVVKIRCCDPRTSPADARVSCIRHGTSAKRTGPHTRGPSGMYCLTSLRHAKRRSQ